MLTGKRFLICGLSRLTVRVAAALVSDNAAVEILLDSPDVNRYAKFLPDKVVVRDDISLKGIVTESRFECILALADDDLNNLRIAAEAAKISPGTPVVVRAFDPTLADQLEKGLGIRRAYSVSALSAPGFVMAAMGQAVLDTLRLGDQEVPLVEIEALRGAECIGLTPLQLKERLRCAVLAIKKADKPWTIVGATGSGAVIEVGDQLVIGGLLRDVLKLGVDNSTLRRSRWKRRPRFSLPRRRIASISLLPQTAAGLLAFLILSVWVFARALHLSLIDSIYFVVTTATTTGYGDISLRDGPDWVKMFGAVVMLSGGALLGIVFSQLAAAATANRIEEVNGRRAQRLNGHVVVVGLGNLGFRVVRLLTEAGVPVAVIERNPAGEFVESIRERGPVIIGDARLIDDLNRVGIGGCSGVIACTEDDLTNIQMCLHTRRLAPEATTVARVFDDALADQLSGALAIDRALSASAMASSAFIGAATDDRAFRKLMIGGRPYLAFRYVAQSDIPGPTIETWRERGIRVLALRRADLPVQPPMAHLPNLQASDELILCGPSEPVLELLNGKLG